MWLPWKAALALAVALAIVPLLVVFGLFGRPRGRVTMFVYAFARETAVVLGLYALWQYAGTLSLLNVNGAIARARWIAHLQHEVHLPSEVWVQHRALDWSLFTQALNVFYATVHFPAMIAFLIWMFIRHREGYPQVRNTVVLVTGAALAIQLIPVAPPRLTPGLGFVDTAALYHQSVYAKVGTPGPDQLSAMPSVHVGWAVLIAFVVITVSSSRWRWLILAHPVATTVVVVATANHFWLDGIVAAGILVVALLIATRAESWLARRRVRGRAAASAGPVADAMPADSATVAP